MKRGRERESKSREWEGRAEKLSALDTRQRQKNGEKFIARYYFPLDEQTSRRATFGTHCAAAFL